MYPIPRFRTNTRLISLVNDNRVDNNLKDILVYAYFGSIVNNRPKKGLFRIKAESAIRGFAARLQHVLLL